MAEIDREPWRRVSSGLDEADVLVCRDASDYWLVVRDGLVLSGYRTVEAAIEEGRALIQRDRTALWLMSEGSVRVVGSYRIGRWRQGA